MNLLRRLKRTLRFLAKTKKWSLACRRELFSRDHENSTRLPPSANLPHGGFVSEWRQRRTRRHSSPLVSSEQYNCIFCCRFSLGFSGVMMGLSSMNRPYRRRSGLQMCRLVLTAYCCASFRQLPDLLRLHARSVPLDRAATRLNNE